MNSTTEPGQPWVRIREAHRGDADMKEMDVDAVNARHELGIAVQRRFQHGLTR
jgi:hypothetical protein